MTDVSRTADPLTPEQIAAQPFTDADLAHWRQREVLDDGSMWLDKDVVNIVRRFLATLDATRPSGDEALRAALDRLEEHECGKFPNRDALLVKSEVLATLATPSSAPDVEGLATICLTEDEFAVILAKVAAPVDPDVLYEALFAGGSLESHGKGVGKVGRMYVTRPAARRIAAAYAALATPDRPGILDDSVEGNVQRVDALRVLELALASQGYPQVNAPSLLRDIEEGGYTLRLTTHEERLRRNERGYSA